MTDKPKFYDLMMFPYPSGTAMHVGHASNYLYSEIVARYKRMRGYDVVFPLGYDSFGLPTENFAIKNNKSAWQATEDNIKYFEEQVEAMDFSLDKDRMFKTSDPEYYKWTQWIFAKLFEHGLVYRKDGLVNRCPSCQTVLANDQVVDGKCERCDSVIEQKQMPQWYIKITDYAEQLLDYSDCDWPEETMTHQKNWIGKSEGAEINFELDGDVDKIITVFTTRPDTLFGVTAIVLAPENQIIDNILPDDKKQELKNFRDKVARMSSIDRQSADRSKSGINSGAYVIHPFTGEKVPVWYGDYVLPDYATGAVMFVPAHDERDREFAQKYGLQARQVISPLPEGEVGGGGPGNKKSHIYSSSGDQIDKLIGYARELRKQGTNGEKFVREFLRDRKYNNMKRRRQHPLGNYIADFYCHEAKLVIEIDGPHHTNQKDYDIQRDKYMQEELGLQIIRITTDDLYAKPGLLFESIDDLTPTLSQTEREQYSETLSLSETYTGPGILVNSGQFDGLDNTEAKKTITSELEKQGKGKSKITYRLRDWSVSRQRYWGSPIPIYYTFQDPKYNAYNTDPDKTKWIPHLIPEQELPVILPLDLPNYKPAGKSPLEDHPTFKYYHAPDGQTYLRECDTLDTFMCSSFYYLRFLDPIDTDYLISSEISNKYMPVDLYIGGKEHTVGHLLYSRFIYKFLKDKGYIVNKSKEPFHKLVHQGMVHAADGRKMSKRWGNVIDPMDTIQQYGSDTLRTYIMFMGPIELNKNRNPEAVAGVKRFLDRVERAIEFISDQDNKNIDSLTHQTIKGVTEDIDQLKFNTAVSKIMILTNGIYESKSVTRSNFEKLLLLLSPFATKLTQSLRHKLGNNGNISEQPWPTWDESMITDSDINLPIQINGKMRGTIQVSADISQDQVIDLIQNDERFTKYITGDIKKVIRVPGKICNIIV